MLFKTNKLLKAFPTELKEDVSRVLSMIKQSNKLDFSSRFEVNFSGSKLIIPERIYMNEPSLLQYNTLTDRQQVVLNCLFTRHHDGFIREEHLKKIINQCNDYNWIIPYIIQLTGEYVIEILQVINDNLDSIDKSIIKEFIAENATFYNTIESRVISYWNCNYRSKYPAITDYVGYEIIEYFNA
ncbi:hypothetical protein [Viridibacillus arvi]|uniref:hypothetical protein n=1 Tax=Viridibacillus arvi TaxID=263475 RepID=UPI00187B42E3|nr:hypothetical protein [Viridibacillus sp. JNUCC-6]QOV11857.1 hypothetical protein JNUCC6_03515 [Viridibacillus sp. JNUCC-6]